MWYVNLRNTLKTVYDDIGFILTMWYVNHGQYLEGHPNSNLIYINYVVCK